MIKVALLSRWHVHADDYARQAKENENLSIEMVWDEEADRGENWAKELGVPFEADLDKVLSNPDIDAVIVSTPTNLHHEVIIGAAKNKKHIFTEKVLAFTVKEVNEIYEAVEENGVSLVLSLPRLTDNNYLYAEKAIEEGWLGKVNTVRVRLAHNGAVAPEGQEHGWLPPRFFDKEQAGGGALMDLGAHPIYLTNRLAGKAKGVYARLHKEDQAKDVDENSAMLVDYESGILGIIEASFISGGSPFQLQVYGTEGALLISDGKVFVNSAKVESGEQTEKLPAIPNPMEQWIDEIKNDTAPTITKEDVVNLTLLNEAALKSHEEGRRIDVSEILG